jgi:radical SAM protein with 4Fe4S-binding SPASM domain
MQEPYLIQRNGPTDPDKRIKPLFCIPTLTHIEITYACMEDCIMCYNPTRTQVSDRDKGIVWDIVRSIANSRVPHTYLIGGEPTFGYKKEELEEFVEYLSDHGSSVTIVTNGQIRLRGMTQRLACYGVSIHGADAGTHDSITRTPGSWERAIATARSYVEEGHDVRIIPVVMGMNHDQMYRIAELAWNIGAESLYYDIYEPGGIGEVNSHVATLRMQPTYEELRIALGQIVQAHDDFPFRGSIGLGTAFPYCFDERLVERGMVANCGVGTYFSAITNTGDFRICNQSKMRFGNVLETPIESIWNSPSIDETFRALKWVEEPCASCPVLEDCGGGCKVDEGCTTGEFCIDRNVRGLSPELKLKLTQKDIKRQQLANDFPEEWRLFKPNRYLAITDRYADRGDIFFKTRYQTVRIGANEQSLLESIQEAKGIINEQDFVYAYHDQVETTELRRFVSRLSQAGAIDVLGVQ